MVKDAGSKHPLFTDGDTSLEKLVVARDSSVNQCWARLSDPSHQDNGLQELSPLTNQRGVSPVSSN